MITELPSGTKKLPSYRYDDDDMMMMMMMIVCFRLTALRSCTADNDDDDDNGAFLLGGFKSGNTAASLVPWDSWALAAR